MGHQANLKYVIYLCLGRIPILYSTHISPAVGVNLFQQINNLTSVAKCYFLMTNSAKANDSVTHAHHSP